MTDQLSDKVAEDTALSPTELQSQVPSTHS